MKELTLTYIKHFGLYLCLCLVCTLLFSLFVYFELCSLTTIELVSFITSSILLVFTCLLFIKGIEKKMLLHLSIYLFIFLIGAFITSNFELSHLLRSFTKAGISFMTSLIFIMRR